jgi:hypothetical protein
MVFRHFAVLCFAIILAVAMMGCASMGGGRISGVNWALANNGGRVSAFSEDTGYPASALIDGVTAPKDWDKEGSGWQALVSMSGVTRSVRTQRDEQERNFVMIEFPQPVTVNEVRIYSVDTEKYPASKFSVSDVLIQYEMVTANKDVLWANVKRPGKGIGDQDDAIRNNIKGVINARFDPVTTSKIRLLIYATNDISMSEDGKSREGAIRIAEIEVYGSGKQKSRKEVDALFQTN